MPYKVVFISESGNRVVKQFSDYSDARRCFWRCRYSKKIQLVSYNFNPYM